MISACLCGREARPQQIHVTTCSDTSHRMISHKVQDKMGTPRRRGEVTKAQPIGPSNGGIRPALLGCWMTMETPMCYHSQAIGPCMSVSSRVGAQRAIR